MATQRLTAQEIEERAEKLAQAVERRADVIAERKDRARIAREIDADLIYCNSFELATTISSSACARGRCPSSSATAATTTTCASCVRRSSKSWWRVS